MPTSNQHQFLTTELEQQETTHLLNVCNSILLISWLVGCSVGQSVVWSVDWLVSWVVSWWVSWSKNVFPWMHSKQQKSLRRLSSFDDRRESSLRLIC